MLIAAKHSTEYTVGRFLGELLLIAIPIWLIVQGRRYERRGRRATPFYVVGWIWLALIVLSWLH
jgi:hypothetical protein